MYPGVLPLIKEFQYRFKHKCQKETHVRGQFNKCTGMYGLLRRWQTLYVLHITL